MKTVFPNKMVYLFVSTILVFVSKDVNAYEIGRLTGEVRMDGSSTVFPIMEAVSEEYGHEQPKVKAPISISGTGGGFNRFVRGEIDLNNASRPIKEEEQATAHQMNIQYTAFQIAYDGLSVIVNSENTWANNLTIEDLRKLWSENRTIKKWSDLHPGWPQKKIHFYAPGVDSGTYDYFQEVVLQEEPMVKSVTLSEDDNVLIRGVMSDRYAIAFLGYAYYSVNKEKVKAIPINGVAPTKETIKSGAYTPLSRPLYVYANHDSIQNKACVYDYLRFTLKHASSLAEEVGYVGLPEKKYKEQLHKLNEIQKERRIN
ncbi:PstS family phosphate ABC transporter substrate-binding protein [Microbacteriaceae bacterium 4G12]